MTAILIVAVLCVLVLLAAVAFIYLTGRERRGWSAQLDRERNSHKVDREALLRKTRELQAENKRLTEEAIRLAAENIELDSRADNAEKTLAAQAHAR